MLRYLLHTAKAYVYDSRGPGLNKREDGSTNNTAAMTNLFQPITWCDDLSRCVEYTKTNAAKKGIVLQYAMLY